MVEAVEFLIGLAVALAALADVFATILVPGQSRTPLRLANRLISLGLRVGRLIASRGGRPSRRPTNGFAPALSILAAFGWLSLLLVGFGLMIHAAGSDFTPRLIRLDDALYVSGSSLLTLGVSEVDAHGAARWLILAEALSGFAVISATVTFTLQIQAGLHQREPQVLTLAGLAGDPPTGIAILQEFGELDIRDELPRFFYDWRQWSADLTHSHLSYPILAHFHSADAKGDWLAALEAVLDAATIVMSLLDHEARGAATLMHRAGSRAAAELCLAFRLQPKERAEVGSDDVSRLVEKLVAAGYRVRPGRRSEECLKTLRRDYGPTLAALAGYLGADDARLLPPRSVPGGESRAKEA